MLMRSSRIVLMASVLLAGHQESAGARGASAVDLSRYVGKYPSDRVGGVRFRDQPAVRAAIVRTTPKGVVREALLHGAGPETPIVVRNRRLLSWACEAHNCGSHNWTLLVAADGSDPEVCYHDLDAGGTRWFRDGVVERGRTGDCPSGDAT